VLHQKLDDVIEITNAFLKEVRSQQARRVCVFATEAVRRLSGPHVDILREHIPGLEVIDRKTEAECSLLGALFPFQTPKPTPETFIIDLGTGSMELAVGQVSAIGVTLTAYNSHSLGTQNLIERLRNRHGDFRKFSVELRKEVNKLSSFEVEANLCPIVLGSAGTKVAWIKVRKNLSDRYEPGKVHGQIISTESLDRLVEMAIKDPVGVRRVIDPVNPQSPEFETVMTGIVAIDVFLKNLGKAQFKVSANGSRYGVVWMIAVYRKLGFDLPIGSASTTSLV
jgi:exopolyphosphatase/pppGpp-phosphohydrolase